MNQQTLLHLHSVAEDCASEGSAIWWAVQELRDHTTYCPHVFSTNQTANVSFLSCEFHRSQKPRNDHRAINKGPPLCLAPQLIKDSIDKRGERERNKLILKHYFLLCMLLHQCLADPDVLKLTDGTMFLQNISNHPPSDTVSHPGTTESSATLL